MSEHHAGHHEPATDAELEERFSAAHWDERYRTGETAWSGNPNPQLVERVGDLAPGSALEAGAGDGADTVWLAERGWHVTAVDISQVALDLGAAKALAAGLSDRTTWRQADLRGWTPPAASYDLVTAMFLHLPDVDDVNRRLAAAVRPGGALLVVMHHPDDMHHRAHWAGPGFFRTPTELAAVLDADDWEITLAEPTRPNTHPGADTDVVRDSILFARRRPDRAG